MDPILAGLNERQAEAVVYCDGPELVLAGAGSGKTRVLTSKIAYLIGRMGVPPYRIVALTFTNKAAHEMSDRVKALVGDDLHGMQVSTFHSYGLRYLRRTPGALAALGLPHTFSVFDRGDSKSLIHRAARALGIESKAGSDAALLDRVSRAKASRDPLTLEPAIDGQYRDLYELYERDLKTQGAIDFDDLMTLPLHVMLSDRDLLEQERGRVAWLLVDEYQDVNTPQYQLLRALSGDRGRIAVVGDPDQSIYGWRGADMSLILRFEHDFAGARVVILDQNYRSTGNILGAANAVISRNIDRYKKDLWTQSGNGERVHVLSARNDLDENKFIIDEIERLVGEGYRYGETAVLYRMNALSRGIEQAMLERGVPHRIVRGVSFYDRREVKDVISYLRLATNPRDRTSLERIANAPTRGLGKKGVETLSAALSLAAGTPQEIWSELAAHPPLKGKATAGAAELAKIMSDILRHDDIELAIGIILDSGYREFLETEYQDDWPERIENVEEILSVVPEEGSIAEILAEIALFTDAEGEDKEDAVNLLTLHAAKGLEFPVVFIIGLEENVFPSGRAIDSSEDVEEERRLCYVGMTRARERLYLSNASSRMLFGSFQKNLPSRFLDELPLGAIEREDQTGGIGYSGYVGGGTNRRRWRW